MSETLKQTVDMSIPSWVAIHQVVTAFQEDPNNSAWEATDDPFDFLDHDSETFPEPDPSSSS